MPTRVTSPRSPAQDVAAPSTSPRLLQGTGTQASAGNPGSLLAQGRQGTVPSVSQGDLGQRSTEATGAPALDHRGNDVAATVRESRWAQGVWRSLSDGQKRTLAADLRGMIRQSKAFEAGFETFERSMGRNDRAYTQSRFASAHRLEAHLDRWEEGGADTAGLGRILSEEDDFKDMTDCLEGCISALAPDLTAEARDRSFFVDRGRRPVEADCVRAESVESRHAGITTSEHRTRSMENAFSKDIEHYKGIGRRNSQSRTAESFRRSGTPFIGGASGTVANLMAINEVNLQGRQPTADERDRQETLIGLYASLKVMKGHHSFMECVIPARSYGHFMDVPNPLHQGGEYRLSMQALEARLNALGLRPGLPLSP